VAERHRRRQAGFAGMDVTAVFGGETAEVEDFDFEAALLFDDFASDRGEPPALRAFARAGVLAPRRAVDEKDARRRRGVLLAALGVLDAAARFEPLDRKVVVRIGIARPGLLRARRLAPFVVAV